MKKFIIVLLFTTFIITNHSAQNSNEKKKETANPKVTFIELGSVNCIPCKQMQPVMKAIEAKYGETSKSYFFMMCGLKSKNHMRKNMVLN